MFCAEQLFTESAVLYICKDYRSVIDRTADSVANWDLRTWKYITNTSNSQFNLRNVNIFGHFSAINFAYKSVIVIVFPHKNLPR